MKIEIRQLVSPFNWIEYQVEKGHVKLQRLDLELDTYTLLLPPMNRKLPFEPFTDLRLTIGNKLIYFKMASDNLAMDKKNIDYVSSISLIEPTKYFEYIQLPSLSFTQPTDGTTRYTYKSAIERLKTIAFSLDQVYTPRPFTLSSDFDEAKFNERMPQLSLDNPNLRESLDEILKPLNGVCRMENNILYFEEFNKVGKQVYIDDSITFNGYSSIENYGNYIEVNARNAYHDKNTLQRTKTTPFLPLLATGDILTTNNGEWRLGEQERIVTIAKARWRVRTTESEDEDIPSDLRLPLATIDVTEFLFEKKIYDELDISWGGFSEYPGTGNYQRTAFYYSQYGNKLQGMFRTFPAFLVDRIALTEILRAYAIKRGVPSNKAAFWFKTPEVLRETTCELTYIPMINARLRQRKGKLMNQYIGYQANQSDSIVDLSSLGMNLKSTLERTGNPYIELTREVSDYDDAYKVGDYVIYEGKRFVATVVEDVIFRESDVSSKAIFYENFQSISGRVGIDNQRRQFEIGEEIKREDNYEQFAIFKEGSFINNGVASNYSTRALQLFMHTFVTSVPPASVNNKPLYSVWFRDGESQPSILVPCQCGSFGQSLFYRFEFETPLSAGDRLRNFNGEFVNQPVLYTNNQGIVEHYKVALYGFWLFGANYTELLNASRNLPNSPNIYLTEDWYTNDSSRILTTERLDVKKDPSETLALTIQLQCLSRVENKFILGDQFFKDNHLVSDSRGIKTRNVYTHNEEYLGLETTKRKPVGSLMVASVVSYTIQNSGANKGGTLTISNLFGTFKSISISDENDNLVLAINTTSTSGVYHIEFSNTRF
jgi:hypothetical protein